MGLLILLLSHPEKNDIYESHSIFVPKTIPVTQKDFSPIKMETLA